MNFFKVKRKVIHKMDCKKTEMSKINYHFGCLFIQNYKYSKISSKNLFKGKNKCNVKI